MLEHKSQKLVPRSVFIRRLLGNLFISTLLVSIALSIGVAGYHWIGGLGVIDSLLNASMILGGMGPVDVLQTDAAKLFASFYALFSGLFFIGIMGFMLTPLIHRVMHTLHADK